ncbi:MAG: stage III sporulation AC/AD family protein [Oscillospiraceae bacterium]|nr:stage III sporulation AC/AD family protein [Oscillospiraceae bacterium]
MMRTAAAALTVSVLGLLLKRRDPEIALLMGVLAAACILFAAAAPMGGLAKLWELLRDLSGQDDRLIGPVLKCLGVSIVTRFASELCRDASQGTAAMAVELAGTACAFTAILPLLMELMRTIGGMV